MTARGASVTLTLLAFCLGWGAFDAAGAGDVRATVRDQRGRPVEDAVVVAVAETPVAAPPTRPMRDVVDQINKEFVPYVKVVLVGTAVSFPNKDDIRHHVYSFSPAKTFELPLYAGTPANPVVFDRPGVVTIGCNIHDWMIAHVYVSESPWFGKTGADGRARLEGLPRGRYAVRVWHPRMSGSERATARPLTVEPAGTADAAWQLELQPDLRPRRAPVAGQRGYR
jgi:plastocyanin